MLAALLPALVPILGDAIRRLFPDPAEAAKAQAELNNALIANAAKIEEAAASIIADEAKSEHWLTSSWRPLVMLTFTALIVARWLGYSAPGISEAEVLKLWDIVQLAYAKRAADIAAYGTELDRLRAKFDPVFAASKRYESALTEIAQAESVGAINAGIASRARDQVTKAFSDAVGPVRAVAAATTDMAAKNTAASVTTNGVLCHARPEDPRRHPLA